MHWTNRTWLVALAVSLPLALAVPVVAAEAESGYQREAVITGPRDLVWTLLTTEDGIRSWLAPQAEVDLRVGGLVRTHQDARGRLGDAQTTVSRILALKPKKAISLKLEQAPDGYPMAQFIEGTWYQIALDALPGGKTRIRCVGNGLATGWAAYAVRPAFEQGLDLVFGQLQKAVDRSRERAGRR
jgi:uncharacterized protein YndB with AHSA1/START domain